MLFLLHLVSKMRRPAYGGSRMAIVLNGSPLFSGGAGGGESNIRKWLLDNDLVEAIIGLPKDMFYNTGISTYIWILTNRKAPEREGTVQLIDAREFYGKLRKGLGSKRNELTPADIDPHRLPLLRLRRRRALEDLPQRGLPLPHHHRRTPAEAPLAKPPRGRCAASFSHRRVSCYPRTTCESLWTFAFGTSPN